METFRDKLFFQMKKDKKVMLVLGWVLLIPSALMTMICLLGFSMMYKEDPDQVGYQAVVVSIVFLFLLAFSLVLLICGFNYYKFYFKRHPEVEWLIYDLDANKVYEDCDIVVSLNAVAPISQLKAIVNKNKIQTAYISQQPSTKGMFQPIIVKTTDCLVYFHVNNVGKVLNILEQFAKMNAIIQ